MTQKGNKGGRDGDPDRIPDEDIGALADSNGAHTHHNLTPFSGRLSMFLQILHFVLPSGLPFKTIISLGFLIGR